MTLNKAQHSPCSCHQVLGETDVQEAPGDPADQEHLVHHQFPEDHEDPGKTSQWKLEPVAKYLLSKKAKSTDILMEMVCSFF